MLRLALEIPTAMLTRWAPMVDLDFILAHKVLQDEEYAEFFARRTPGRELILDNSTHEFGVPLPLSDLEMAASLCEADWLIAPDIVNPSINEEQVALNTKWMIDTCTAIHDTQIGAVLCGLTKEQRHRWLNEAQGRIRMMCFTFHEPNRLQWWDDFKDHDSFLHYERIHVLGVSTLDEMKRWVDISEQHPFQDFSIDTTKAVKWGYQLKEIDKLESLRGGPIDAKTVLELEEWTPEQIQCVEHNIAVLKKICKGE